MVARRSIPAAEIVMFDNFIVVYKCLGDLMFYVTGSQDENELILYSVLQAFYESISLLLRCPSHACTRATAWKHTATAAASMA